MVTKIKGIIDERSIASRMMEFALGNRRNILKKGKTALSFPTTGFEFQFFIHLQILASCFYFHLQNQNWTGIFF